MTGTDVLDGIAPPEVMPARRGKARLGTMAEVALGVSIGLVAAVVTLRGVLVSAYGADDIWASQSPAYQAAERLTLWQQWLSATTQWMSSQGRFFPATTADWFLVYDTFTTRESYKAFQLVIALLALATYAVWASRAFRTVWAGLLAVVVALACSQFRFFYDPFLHFAGQQSLLVIAMFGCLIVVQSFVRASQPRLVLAVAATLLWSLALTTYESSYLVVPAALAIIWVEQAPRSRRIGACLTIAVPTLVLGALVAVLRARMTHPSEVYSANLDPTQLLPTLAKQLFATLPLSFTWAQHGHGIPSLSHAFQLSVWSATLLVAVAALATVAILRVPRPTTPQLVTMFALGASCLLSAGLVTAVSRYWQDALQFGQGYVGVLVQSLGLALIVVAAAAFVPRQGSRLARAARVGSALVCGLVLGLTVVVTGQQNYRVVTASDPSLGSWAAQSSLGFPREVTLAAFGRGLLDGYPISDTVYGSPGGPWFNATVLSYTSGHRVTVPNQWPYWTLAPGSDTRLPGCANVGPCSLPAAPIETVSVRAQSYDRGTVVLAQAIRIDQFGAPPADAVVTTRQARVYYSAYGSGGQVCGTAPRVSSEYSGVLIASHTHIVATGPGWTIEDVSFPRPGVAASSIGIRLPGQSACH